MEDACGTEVLVEHSIDINRVLARDVGALLERDEDLPPVAPADGLAQVRHWNLEEIFELVDIRRRQKPPDELVVGGQRRDGRAAAPLNDVVQPIVLRSNREGLDTRKSTLVLQNTLNTRVRLEMAEPQRPLMTWLRRLS